MKNIIILGAGESGFGSAVLAQKKGFNVFLSDKGKIKDKYKILLIKNNIPFEEDSHDEARILSADLVIKSPGIPKKAEIINKIKDKNIPIISEIEFASKYTNAKIIAITGSNGKTTTTSLTYFILKKAGLNVGLAGNIGKSFALQVATENFDYYVLEISSFQLDDCHEFKPNIAILLNLSPDHLDQYDYNYNKYIEAKFKITKNMDRHDFFITNFDDLKIQEIQERYNIKAHKVNFSVENNPEITAYKEKEKLKINLEPNFSMNINDLAIKGTHNLANAMASGIAAKLLNLKNKQIEESMSQFEGVEHRLEKVGTIEGVNFINDSKATNVNSVYYALATIKSPIILILGGIDKGNDYSEILNLIQEKVKTIVCLGTDNSKIISYFKDKIENIIETSSMKDAVYASYSFANEGDTILLSPACASFDLFQNFEHRGNEFKKEFLLLQE